MIILDKKWALAQFSFNGDFLVFVDVGGVRSFKRATVITTKAAMTVAFIDLI
ncbi:hypothetical protein OAP14_08050 [Aliiglaciecola sp.]|nr:hypothetical protein [Aliiglaciecola sp.]